MLKSLIFLASSAILPPDMPTLGVSEPDVIVAETANAPISAPKRNIPCALGCLSPVDAIAYAAYLAPRAGVAGEFAMPVRAVGFEKGRFFLNSEADYRDRNCLTVVISAETMKQIAGTDDLEKVRQHFVGKRVITRGVAKQVRIEFTSDGQPSGKYYYQVHLAVNSKKQILRVAG